jgi:hypothetical protein
MQRIFSAEGPWPTPWMDRVLPVAAALANRHPERTVFTRFIPPERPDQMPGMWRRYYMRWRLPTRKCPDLRLLELMPPLAALCPPATVIDKTRYSALAEPKLAEHLRQREAVTPPARAGQPRSSLLSLGEASCVPPMGTSGRKPLKHRTLRSFRRLGKSGRRGRDCPQVA